MDPFTIRVYKQYFNFASSHFLIFQDGTREPLHGHNYRVTVKGSGPLQSDMVLDFLDFKPIVKRLCDSLDHKLLLPNENPYLKLVTLEKYYQVITPTEEVFQFPKDDVLFLPISNTSAERLALYLAQQIAEELKVKLNFQFKALEVEVEESPGQSASYLLETSEELSR